MRAKRGIITTMKHSNVTIGTTTYDRKTGLPISTTKQQGKPESTKAATPVQKSHSIHRGRLKKSNTLHRTYVKKPAEAKTQSPQAISTKVVAKKTTTTNNVRVATTKQRLAIKNQPRAIRQATPIKTVDGMRTKRTSPALVTPTKTASHRPQPVAKKATFRQTAPIQSPSNTISSIRPAAAAQTPKINTQPQRQHTPSSILKKEAEHKALSEAPSHNKRNRTKVHKKHSKRPKKATGFAAAGVAMAMLFGYFGYVNMPNISVRVAAAQAGIDASFPGYQPNGYSVNGPVAFDKGSVRVAFALNGSDRGFTITQSKTSWDSIAALENYVVPKSNNSYATTQENGLTIYSFNGNAAWVNKGILYTITGDAPLSNQQIESIATSM